MKWLVASGVLVALLAVWQLSKPVDARLFGTTAISTGAERVGTGVAVAAAVAALPSVSSLL